MRNGKQLKGPTYPRRTGSRMSRDSGQIIQMGAVPHSAGSSAKFYDARSQGTKSRIICDTIENGHAPKTGRSPDASAAEAVVEHRHPKGGLRSAVSEAALARSTQQKPRP